jgi:hypothetical protein
MPKAYVHLPAHVEQRRAAFIDGLARLGFAVIQGQPERPIPPGDVAVTWNLTPRSRQSLEMARAGGGALIVTENGYCGEDRNGLKPYAIALDGHAGAGRWYAPDDSRLIPLDLPFEPFTVKQQGYVLLADQRGLGSPKMRSPHDFANTTSHLIRAATGLPVNVRHHPGRHVPVQSLDRDLEGARALVVWSSNCATAALIKGVPTFYRAPAIVTAGAAKPFHPSLVGEFTDSDRHAAFSRLTWAQWFLDEIATGEPFRHLLDVHAGKLASCQPGLGL